MPTKRRREQRVQGEGCLYAALGNPQSGDVAAGLFMPKGGFVFCAFRGGNSEYIRWALSKVKSRDVPLVVEQSGGEKHWARKQLFAKFPEAAEQVRQLAAQQLELDPGNPWLQGLVEDQEPNSND